MPGESTRLLGSRRYQCANYTQTIASISFHAARLYAVWPITPFQSGHPCGHVFFGQDSHIVKSFWHSINCKPQLHKRLIRVPLSPASVALHSSRVPRALERTQTVTNLALIGAQSPSSYTAISRYVHGFEVVFNGYARKSEPTESPVWDQPVGEQALSLLSEDVSSRRSEIRIPC